MKPEDWIDCKLGPSSDVERAFGLVDAQGAEMTEREQAIVQAMRALLSAQERSHACLRSLKGTEMSLIHTECSGNCNQGRNCDCGTFMTPSETAVFWLWALAPAVSVLAVLVLVFL